MLTRGVDVSVVQAHRRVDGTYQSVVDWEWLVSRHQVQFAAVRCGNGNDGPDPSFKAHSDAATAAGVSCVFPYDVGFPLPADPAHPGREPEKQAQAHFAACQGKRHFLDLEWPEPGSADWKKYQALYPAFGATFVRDWACAWHAEMGRLQGCSSGHYDGYPDYVQEVGIPGDERFASQPLWAVDYPAAFSNGSWPSDDSLLVVPGPWLEWTFWQISGGKLRLPNGVEIDADVFNGDIGELRAFANGC